MECVEDLVLSFLTQLSEALPDAYSQSDGDPKKGSGKKVVLRLADRTKEYSEEYVMPLRSILVH